MTPAQPGEVVPPEPVSEHVTRLRLNLGAAQGVNPIL